MFYYPNVLQRHTGCFSTIWLAATRGIRITRRELLRVNVKRTCMDILDYVTAQVLPPQPNLPKPRFSLYLSSQLQYGVVVVYHQQCGFLLEEVQQTIDRLLRSKRCIHIDMAESDRIALDIPDSLYMMEKAEGAQDPFFGLMESCQLPSPYRIHQTQFVTEEVGSQHSLVPSPHTTKGFRSSPAAITMMEKEQFVITTAEYFEGDDFPEATDRDIDLLMEQPDQFRSEVEGRTREVEGAMSSVDQLKESMLGTERDSVWLLDEESGRPVEVLLEPVALEMTPPHVAMPTPPSGKVGDIVTESLCEEVVAPPLKKRGGRGRRQLVFADPQMQISDTAMKEQIGNPTAETLDPSMALLDLQSLTKHASPAQLFSTPCGSLLHADLLSLWKQQASLAVLPGQGDKNKGEEEEEDDEEARRESEQDREILRMERKRRRSGMKEITSESGLQPAEGSSVLDVILDISKEDKSASDVITPVGRWSPQEEVQPPMEPIAEENIELPEAQTDTESRSMLSWISSNLQSFGKVTFDSLLPPEADRSTAAHTLYKLLELLSAGQVTAGQTEPYSDITIKPAALSMDV
ncbi:REC8 meiotic recombination protein b [Stegastes partitus]|uniref:REC8 meiotic recombination protein b n=1 Tax=Stegastes partitus TaxID=144197 RepID=A0A9Y4MQV7_9TELE|nr:PREDICTED: meiotic recombination protein REC8 homolog [Stegastes partitus]